MSSPWRSSRRGFVVAVVPTTVVIGEVVGPTLAGPNQRQREDRGVDQDDD
jgi:hypothetical protein